MTTPASQFPLTAKKKGNSLNNRNPSKRILRKCGKDAEGGSHLMASDEGTGGEQLSSTRGAGQ